MFAKLENLGPGLCALVRRDQDGDTGSQCDLDKPGAQEGLDFKTIAEAVPGMNQILYNVPGRTACDMLNETVERLADIPNIVGIKDATGNIPRGSELIEAVKGRLAVYSGDDATAADLMLAGAKGNVSVTANVAPKAMSQLCEAAVAGDQGETARLNELLMPLNRKLFLEPIRFR